MTTPTAASIAAIPDTGARRQAAATAHADRRTELALLAQLLHERDGGRPAAKRIPLLEQADAPLAELSLLATA